MTALYKLVSITTPSSDLRQAAETLVETIEQRIPSATSIELWDRRAAEVPTNHLPLVPYGCFQVRVRVYVHTLDDLKHEEPATPSTRSHLLEVERVCSWVSLMANRQGPLGFVGELERAITEAHLAKL